jgi:hypothetical protein
MTSNIEIPDDSYDFEKLSLANPIILQQQVYFSKLLHNNNEIYIQMPKCASKQGFVNSAKRYYCDLMFSNTNNQIIEWFEKLDSKIQSLIFEKRKNWFHEDIDQNDIENIFTSPLRTYKSGKYLLLRTMLNSPRMLQSNNISIFDENENEMTMEDVNENTEFISILHIHGVKFSSKNFQIYIEMKQMMIVNSINKVFNKCLIKANQNDGAKLEENSNMEESKLQNKVKGHDEKKEVTEVSQDKESDKLKNDPENHAANNKDNKDNKLQDNMNNNQHDITDDKLKDEVENNSNNDTNDIKEKSIKIETENSVEADLNDEKLEQVVGIDNDNIEDISKELIKSEGVKEIDLGDLEVDKSKHLEEVNLELSDTSNLETIQLNKTNEKYLTEYREAKEKARKARIVALKSLLKAKNIKDKYLLDNMEISDDEEDNTTIHTSDLESNIDSLESFSEDEEELQT